MIERCSKSHDKTYQVLPLHTAGADTHEVTPGPARAQRPRARSIIALCKKTNNTTVITRPIDDLIRSLRCRCSV